MSPSYSRHAALFRRERVPDCILPTWLAVGWVAVALLPWHALEDGILAGGALAGYPWSVASAPALFALASGQFFMLPLLVPLVAAPFRLAVPLDTESARLLIASAVIGLLWLLFLMLAIGLNGWNFPALDAVFGALLRHGALGHRRHRLEHAAARPADRSVLDPARHRLRPRRVAHAPRRQPHPRRRFSAADYHAALRHRPRGHPAVRAGRRRQRS